MIDVRPDRESLRRAYNFLAPFYGLWSWLTERASLERAFLMAAVRPGERVLDAGVGAGAAASGLHARLGPSGLLVGADFAMRMLMHTRRRVPRCLLTAADVRALPFAGESFDLVWCSFVLDLIPTSDIPVVLGEFRRVMRIGGRLVAICLTRIQERPGLWERAYQRSPLWATAYLFGGCRPIQALPFLRNAGFAGLEREVVRGILPAEILLGRKAE